MSAVLHEIEPPGIFHGMPIETYHASAALSNSGLNDFARSPAHYHASHLDPRRPAEEETAAQLVGNLGHCMILEPHEFGKRYAVGPCDDRRLKAWKAWEDIVDEHAVKIKPSERAVAFAQAASVRKIADVEALLATGRPEVSAFWVDPVTGERCRCRPDWEHTVGNRGVILLDVKTCGNASPREFARQVARMGYHRQAAFYSDGYELAAGVTVLGFVFVAVECDYPYAASAVMLDDESLDKGRAEIAEMLPRFAECRATNVWPGYGDTVSLISLPAWALASEA